MTNTPHPWDRRADATPKSYAAFLAYVALGARRSVREAARQNHSKTIAAGEISGAEDTMVGTWMGWSAKHKWMSRSLAREEWIARTSDEQIIINKLACDLALVTRAHDFLKSSDSEVFLRGARAFTLQHPPVQRVENPLDSHKPVEISDLRPCGALHSRTRRVPLGSQNSRLYCLRRWLQTTVFQRVSAEF